MPYASIERQRESQRLYANKRDEKGRTPLTRLRQKKQALMSGYKAGMGCYLCGESNPRCLDFHHVDPNEKSDEVMNMVMRRQASWDTVFDEVSKCLLICSNCHRKVIH